ncbi:hypothetical protein [Fusobacterium sp. FSA-380-WT-2B]|jgi:hypothetical protein|uniref:hypothetical protein n=1 Tax=Fusobacterium sp. FSA-380-WT-2B TaxID=2605786 RepID=UPI0012B3BA93|nr:hypothetical protein [Fusobacterium sp. FSA-380-WT-2B]MSS61450.1 hypothetical protein [Fusobacterium sp. FSA-380-WT-2B]
MKKLLIGALTILALVGCGSDFKYESKNEKEEFLTKLMKTDDKNLQEEYDKIIADLKAKVEKKDDKAIDELKEWKGLYFELSERYHKKIDTSNMDSGLGDLLTGKKRKYAE